jgi:hypothetical protein
MVLCMFAYTHIPTYINTDAFVIYKNELLESSYVKIIKQILK